MSDEKNLHQESIESENNIEAIGQPKESEKRFEQGALSPEKEGNIEIGSINAEREQVLREVGKAEQEIKTVGGLAFGSARQKYQQREKQIEKILEDGLSGLYIKMPDGKKKEFQIAGERTSQKINSLLSSAKVKIKDIISLIRKWLLIIPGVNKFFLEQETKIKADKIMSIKK